MALGLFWTSVALCGFVAILAFDIMGFLRRKNHFDVEGRTVVITGGSQGMGRGLARLLAQKGANVVIVARDKQKLSKALEYISSAAKNPSAQRFHLISADLTKAEENDRLISEVTEWNGGEPPDIVWANAGSAQPGLFIDASIETLRSQMDIDYWAAAYLAHSTLRTWLRSSSKLDKTTPETSTSERKPRHFIMTSSVVAFAGFTGYGAYAPAKSAIRSLADTLRQEIGLYNGHRRSNPASGPSADVKIHCVFPATITSPGYEEEERLKHPVTKMLEEGDPRQNEDEVAAAAIKGLEKGAYLITTTFLGHVMRVGSLGNSARNNVVVDTLFSWVASIAWLFVGPEMDGKVFDYGKNNAVKLP